MILFFALFLEDDVITVKTPAFAESVTEGDVRWEKGKVNALSLKFKYFLKVPSTATTSTIIGGICGSTLFFTCSVTFSWPWRKGVL